MSLLLFSSSFPSKLQFCGKGEDSAVLGNGHMVRLSLGKPYSSSYCLRICNFKSKGRKKKEDNSSNMLENACKVSLLFIKITRTQHPCLILDIHSWHYIYKMVHTFKETNKLLFKTAVFPSSWFLQYHIKIKTKEFFIQLAVIKHCIIIFGRFAILILFSLNTFEYIITHTIFLPQLPQYCY